MSRGQKNDATDRSSVLENRLAIFINDETLDPAEYSVHMRVIASQYGRIKHMNIPEISKRRNLVFIEFEDRKSAESALKGINGDKELRMNASWARAPTDKNDAKPASEGGKGQENRSKRNPAGGSTAGARPNKPSSSRKGGGGLLPTPGTSYVSKVPDTKPVKFLPFQAHSSRQEPPKAAPKKTFEPKTNGNVHVNGTTPKRNDEKSPKWSPPREESIDDNDAVPKLESTAQPCNLCCKKADLRCERCGDYYCSAECQRKDWRAHKPMCFPMPGLIKAVETHNETPVRTPTPPPTKTLAPVTAPKQASPEKSTELAAFRTLSNIKSPKPKKIDKKNRMIRYCPPPASGSEVFITWPVSSNCCFIVSLEKAIFKEYQQALDDVLQTVETAEPVTAQCEAGDLVYAEFEGAWARALVQKVVNETTVLVAFFDFGNTAMAEWSGLRKYEPEGDVTRYTFRIFLKYVPHRTDLKAESHLKRMVDEYRRFIIRYHGELNRETKASLYDKETCECVNDIICEFLGERIDEIEPADEQLWTYEDLEEFNIESGQPVNIVILSNDNLENGVVQCTLESLQSKVESIQSRVNRYAQEQGRRKLYSPAVHELCIIPDEDRNWQRAALVAPAPTGQGEATCFSIDFGVIMDVSTTDILKFNKDLADRIFSHQCAIMDLGDSVPPLVLKELQKRLDIGTVHEVKKITKNHETNQFVLHMPDLIDIVLGDN